MKSFWMNLFSIPVLSLGLVACGDSSTSNTNTDVTLNSSDRTSWKLQSIGSLAVPEINTVYLQVLNKPALTALESDECSGAVMIVQGSSGLYRLYEDNCNSVYVTFTLETQRNIAEVKNTLRDLGEFRISSLSGELNLATLTFIPAN